MTVRCPKCNRGDNLLIIGNHDKPESYRCRDCEAYFTLWQQVEIEALVAELQTLRRDTHADAYLENLSLQAAKNQADSILLLMTNLKKWIDGK